MRYAIHIITALSGVLLVAGCEPDTPSGIFACKTARDCPDDFVCRAEGDDAQRYCYDGEAPRSSGNGGSRPDDAGDGGDDTDEASGRGGRASSGSGGSGGSDSDAGDGGAAISGGTTGGESGTGSTGLARAIWDDTDWDECTWQ